MASSRTAPLVILGLTTVTAAGVAWQQYQRAESLAQEIAATRSAPSLVQEAPATRAPATLAITEVDRADAIEPTSAPEAISPPDENTPQPRRRGQRGGGFARMEQLMQDPTFSAAFQTQQKAMLDGRYAELFRKLDLSPAQLDQFKTLLAERQTAWRDVMGAARSEGLNRGESRDQLRELVEITQNEIDSEIRSTLGTDVYDQFVQFDQTTAQRNVVNQLDSRLSYSGTPLNSAQSEALVTILAETSGGSAQGTAQAGMIRAIGGGNVSFNGATTPISDQAIARASGVLSTDQLSALQELQAEQQAQQTMSEYFRSQFRPDRNVDNNARTGTSPATGVSVPPTGG